MNDYWITARYASKCKECECDISEGDRVLYSRNERGYGEVYCRPCGEDLRSLESDPEVDVG